MAVFVNFPITLFRKTCECLEASFDEDKRKVDQMQTELKVLSSLHLTFTVNFLAKIFDFCLQNRRPFLLCLSSVSGMKNLLTYKMAYNLMPYSE